MFTVAAPTLWGWACISCASWGVVKDLAGLSLERHRQTSWDIGESDVCPAVPLVWLEWEPLSDVVNAGLMHNKQFAVLMNKIKPILWLYQNNRALIFQVKSCHNWNCLGWREKHQPSMWLNIWLFWIASMFSHNEEYVACILL